MDSETDAAISRLLAGQEEAILAAWLEALSNASLDGRVGRGELEAQARELLQGLREAAAAGDVSNLRGAGMGRVRDFLGTLSRSRALQGFSPSETAVFVLSLKRPLFSRLRAMHGRDGEAVARDTWAVSELLDGLGLHTMEMYQKGREEIILRQQQEISELSTPVVKLWAGVLALPLIGTLDSARTQVVMENLLQSIVDNGAEIAIIDITGVPTVDTLVAQHLLKTIAAARLMGADCIISGIRPQIAQTMVHLGVELNVVSKASLADAFALALERIGRAVVPVRPGHAASAWAGPRPGGPA